MTRDEVLALVMELSDEDRAAVVAAAAEPPPNWTGPGRPIEPAVFWAEMHRRLAAHDADPSRAITLDQFRAKLAGRE